MERDIYWRELGFSPWDVGTRVGAGEEALGKVGAELEESLRKQTLPPSSGRASKDTWGQRHPPAGRVGFLNRKLLLCEHLSPQLTGQAPWGNG